MPGSAQYALLDSFRKLSRHHFPSIDPATINNEVSVADGVDHPLFPSLSVDMGSNALENHDVVLANYFADRALDIRLALND